MTEKTKLRVVEIETNSLGPNEEDASIIYDDRAYPIRFPREWAHHFVTLHNELAGIDPVKLMAALREFMASWTTIDTGGSVYKTRCAIQEIAVDLHSALKYEVGLEVKE